MGDLNSLKLRWLHGQLLDAASRHLATFSHVPHSAAWQPAVNAYRCDKCVRICVDLAGVDKSEIDLTIEPGRLRIRGRRSLPEPGAPHGKAVQVLAMEIDYGPFERDVLLPAGVDVSRVTAEQKNGLLWIDLPLS